MRKRPIWAADGSLNALKPLMLRTSHRPGSLAHARDGNRYIDSIRISGKGERRSAARLARKMAASFSAA